MLEIDSSKLLDLDNNVCTYTPPSDKLIYKITKALKFDEVYIITVNSLETQTFKFEQFRAEP